MLKNLEELANSTIHHGVQHFRRGDAETVLKLIAVARQAENVVERYKLLTDDAPALGVMQLEAAIRELKGE